MLLLVNNSQSSRDVLVAKLRNLLFSLVFELLEMILFQACHSGYSDLSPSHSPDEVNFNLDGRLSTFGPRWLRILGLLPEEEGGWW
jgi:hypothetical protein